MYLLCSFEFSVIYMCDFVDSFLNFSSLLIFVTKCYLFQVGNSVKPPTLSVSTSISVIYQQLVSLYQKYVDQRALQSASGSNLAHAALIPD